jgi:hypothetical protein
VVPFFLISGKKYEDTFNMKPFIDELVTKLYPEERTNLENSSEWKMRVALSVVSEIVIDVFDSFHEHIVPVMSYVVLNLPKGFGVDDPCLKLLTNFVKGSLIFFNNGKTEKNVIQYAFTSAETLLEKITLPFEILWDEQISKYRY